MKNILFLLLLALQLTLAGCSALYSNNENLPNETTKLIKQKKYKSAIEIINYIKPGHKYYKTLQKQKTRALARSKIIEKDAITRSLELANQGEWVKAFDYLESNTEEIPESSKLKKHKRNLVLRRNHAISEFEDRLLTIEANNLAEKYEIYEQVRKTVTSEEDQKFNFKKFDSSRFNTGRLLAKRSEYQFSKGQHAEALETIKLAEAIHPDKNTLSRLATVKKLIQDEYVKNIRQYLVDSRALLNKLSQGYSHSILHETQSRISWIKAKPDIAAQQKELLDRLEEHLNKGVTQYFNAGLDLYSKGKITQARAIWLDLKKLSPDYPGLEAHIKRANVVLKKLNKLKKQ